MYFLKHKVIWIIAVTPSRRKERQSRLPTPPFFASRQVLTRISPYAFVRKARPVVQIPLVLIQDEKLKFYSSCFLEVS